MAAKSQLIAHSHKYFQLTENCLTELSNNKNKHSVISDFIENETDEESDAKYKNATKWSDFRVIEPILFNFYHAIELLLKGILVLKNIEFEKKHNIGKLYELTENNLVNCDQLLSILKKYCVQTKSNKCIIQEFFKLNNITPSKYYIILKYPFEKKQSFVYGNLHYLENKGVKFAEQIITDIKLMKKEFINI